MTAQNNISRKNQQTSLQICNSKLPLSLYYYYYYYYYYYKC